MSKGNRRINVAKREANELRAALARETLSHAQTARTMGEREAAAQWDATKAKDELRVVEMLLRAYCRHTFALRADPKGKPVGPRQFDALITPPTRAPTFGAPPSCDSFETLRPVELVHFIMRLEETRGPRGFVRYCRFMLRSKEGVDGYWAYAVSRESLELMREDPALLAEDILREFGDALARGLAAPFRA